jgi:hypothetical protein
MDTFGRTPLHWASSNDNESAMRVLVEFGAEIDRRDNDGWTALHYAQSSCAELLIALSADVHLVTHRGRSACHMATEWRKADNLRALVAAGSDLDQRDSEGETPRMIAVRIEAHLPTPDEIDAARRRIAKTRLDLVRERAFQICVGLQSFRLNALQLCEILMHSFGAIGSVILFHQWWAIATKVKHFLVRN